MSNTSDKRLAWVFALFCFPCIAAAEPWLPANDAALRHHVQLLADAGVLHGPVNTWPLSTASLKRDLAAADEAQLDAQTRESLQLLRARLAAPTDVTSLRACGSSSDAGLRDFDADCREQGEVAAAYTHSEERWALRVQANGAVDPLDDRPLRADGSYIAGQFGNVLISAGMVDRWWGPGWQSGLILSNSARPIPSVALQRADTAAPESRWLSWIGPWQLNASIGQMESAQFIPSPFLVALRLDVRPLPSLELGFSRTAIWGGKGRPTGLDSFWDLVTGDDNVRPLADGELPDEPGDQLAGGDFRWSFPAFGARDAVYMELIGEDEAASMPSKFLYTFGLESAFARSGWQHHLALETSNTTSIRHGKQLWTNYAYEHHIYLGGYRRYGRPIGASFDNDSRTVMLLGRHLGSAGREFAWTLGAASLNRDNSSAAPPGGNVLAPGYVRTLYGRAAWAMPLPGAQDWRVKVGGEYYQHELSLGGEPIRSNVFVQLEAVF